MQTSNDITLSFDWMVYNINKLRKLTKNMTEQDETLIEDEQNKLRKEFPNKFMPNCFALGVAIMEYDGSQKKWEDFKPQDLQVSLITKKIYNIEDRHGVQNTEHFHCICGHDISRETSYFYNKGPIWMIVGETCAVKFKLVTHGEILVLKKEKRENKKANEQKLAEKKRSDERAVAKEKRSVEKKRIMEYKKIEEECRPKCRDCGIYFTGIGPTCLNDEDHTWI